MAYLPKLHVIYDCVRTEISHQSTAQTRRVIEKGYQERTIIPSLSTTLTYSACGAGSSSSAYSQAAITPIYPGRKTGPEKKLVLQSSTELQGLPFLIT